MITAYTNTEKHFAIYTRQYPIFPEENLIVDDLTKDMMNKHVIRESTHSWNSPLILLKKKYGSYRPCIYFRNLNDVTIPEKCPIPVISDILQNKHYAFFLFSTLDLESSYWETAINENDTKNSFYYTVTAFRIQCYAIWIEKCVCNIYRRLMSNVLAGLIGPSVSFSLSG